MTDQAARIAQQLLVEAAARHTTHLYRVGSAQYNQIRKIIDGLAGELAAELLERLESLTPAEMEAFTAGRYTTSRLKGLRSTINDWAQHLGREVGSTLASGLREVADNEASFAHRLLNSVLAVPVAASVSGTAAFRAAMGRPIMGQLVAEQLADIETRTRKHIYARIRQGISAGETNFQIVRGLRGTKALQYQDGIFQATRVEAERLVRTATNHVSNVAYDETWTAMGVTEVVDVATLDGRTSKYCASIDGRRHQAGTNHPRPPYHYNCRTVQVPSLDADIMGDRPYIRALKPLGQVPKSQRTDDMVGKVSARTTYAEWFARQPASYQREWLGSTRYQLYKKGGYKLERFVDPLGKQYSVRELRLRDAETFKEIFG